MKVFIVTKEPFPNGMAATKRIICYQKGLLNAGVDCKVLIAKRTEIFGRSVINRVTKGSNYLYVGGATERSSNILVRRYFDFLDTFKTIFYLFKNTKKGDVIMNYLREDPLNLLIIRVARITRAKVVRELCEYPYGFGQENNYIKKKRQRYFKKVFPRFDAFICISEPLKKTAIKYKSNKAKIITVPIMIDTDVSEVKNQKPSIDLPYIFHSGTLYDRKDGILGAIESFAIASNKLSFPIKYILTGELSNSPDQVKIEAVINKYGIKDKVEFTGFISKEKLEGYQNNSSLMLINKPKNMQNTYCFATKLGEYLLTGKPVIITNVGEALKYLKDRDSAFVAETGNVDQLAYIIIEILENKEIANKVGRKGAQIAKENFSHKIQGQKLKSFFQNL